MFNTENIGKRIRMLRKQKRVSQEKMAEDLGLYQADISNLERAMSGSGIADIFKLDMIAEYFGITLAQLLCGFDEAPPAPLPEVKKAEGYEPGDYAITEAKFASDSVFCPSELKLTAPDHSVIFVAFSEFDEVPKFYKAKESIFEKLAGERDDPEVEKKLDRYCFLSGEDYIDIFQNADPKWLPIIRYLIFIATTDEEEARKFVDETTGRLFREINVPVPYREPEELFYPDYSDLSVVYRCRLAIETFKKYPNVYRDLDRQYVKQEKAILEKLKAACVSEDAYKVWKKDLIDAKVKEITEKQKIVVCEYMFIGIGHYKEIMPEEAVPEFRNWIDCNGSAFFCDCRPATKSEIRSYAAREIGGEL